ncbi:hypothetical protein VP01_33g2 [Puccinia sorghi]|uniref:Uncharacterized protein n=1 Tax=Puccinia sorghi TaxID=27349 RepID=A0A0L6UWP1_9BASI|nr:hypothetical protein VP01_33g2 [Puccinia sorghi]
MPESTTSTQSKANTSLSDLSEFKENFPYEAHKRIFIMKSVPLRANLWSRLSKSFKETQSPFKSLIRYHKILKLLSKRHNLIQSLSNDYAAVYALRPTILINQLLGFAPIGLRDPGIPYGSQQKTYPAKIGVAHCLYAGQSITNWLEWLLEKSEIEEAINSWSNQVNNSDQMCDLLTFKNFFWDNKPNSLNIILSMFIDWFNPWGLKIGGKTKLTGVITFTCLNLPPKIRNKPLNICLTTISPGPNSPDPQAVDHLMALHVDELIELQSSISIATHQYPNKHHVQVKLLTPKKALEYANKIKQCRTKNTQDTLLKAYGVRWSELNQLSYWDPTQQVVLGMMHNWLEGILQTHFRYCWGFHLTSQTGKAK